MNREATPRSGHSAGKGLVLCNTPWAPPGHQRRSYARPYQCGYTSLRTLGQEGPCPPRYPMGPSRPPKEELRQALPVWLLLWTMSTLGPMQMIPQTSHFSLPLGSRMPPAPDKALLPWTLCEPFIFSPEASSIRKSSAHSSPFTSQARPFSSSL